MNELVKKIMEKNRKAIDENFKIIMEDKLPTAELIKLEFESIRSLIDYSEKLALEGESAIETLEQVLLIKNGNDFIRCKGSHFMYSNGKNTIAVNKDLNCMVARRLIKQYDLEYAKQEGSNYGLDGF